MKIALLSLLILAPACHKFYTGPGYVVHNDDEAVQFALNWLKQGNLAEAEKMAKVARGINPKNASAYSVLGTVRMKELNCPEAVNYFQQASSHTAESGRARELNNLGYAQFCAGDYESAQQSFKESMAQSENWAASFGLAISAFNLGLKDDAQRYLKMWAGTEKSESNIKSLLEYFRISLDAATNEFSGLKP